MYFRAMRGIFVAIILFIAIITQSCKKELSRPSWDVDVSVPVLFTSMGLENLIPDSLLSSDINNAISILIDESVFRLDLDTLLNLPDTTVSDTFSIPPPFPQINVNPGQTFLNIIETKTFDLNDVELSYVKIESGQTEFFISSTISQPTVYEYTIANATLNGNPFTFTVTVPAGSTSNPAVVNSVFDFSGYELDLRGSSGSEYNKYETNIKVSLSSSAPVTTVYNSDMVIVENTFSNLKPEFAKGYFGSRSIPITYSETSLDFLNNIIGGTLDLDQVDINLSIENGIGVDASVKIDTLLSRNSRNGNDVLLSHSIIGNSININRATNTGSAAISSIYPVQLNNGNSNADLFLENLPDKIGYALEMAINPFGNISGHQDFLYSNKTFDVRVNASIPLNFIANDLTLADTLNFNIETDDADNINHGVIHVFATNGFPLEAELQIFLLDGNGNTLDSVIAPNIILSAFTNPSNIVTAVRDSRIDISLNEFQLDHLLETQRVLLRAVFNTSSQTQHVQLFNTYRLDLRMSTELNYTIE